MLVQVALIVFALSAMLSLVIDVGYARITQGQMQNAADAAALEGIRKRDVTSNAFQSDCLRRAAANRIVHWTFDDNFSAAEGDPDYQFGAGPILNLTDGATSLHGLQTATVPDAHAYKPDLQMNQRNEVYGDMVSGRFCYTSDPARSEGASYDVQDIVCTEPQHATGAYARNDFNPNLTSPAAAAGLGECPAPDDSVPLVAPLPAAGSLAGIDNSAFLVRLRRSNEFQDLAAQTDPDVASSGPSLPLTFGKATTIRSDDPSGDYSVRRDGLTVRATAIAAVRPALHVGAPQANANQVGVTPFALVDTFVPTIGVQPAGRGAGPAPNCAAGRGAPVPPACITINPATGVICRGLTCVGATPATAVGRFVANPTVISTVGRVLPASAARPCPVSSTGYGPVYSQIAAGTPRAATRVIGFARISLAQDLGSGRGRATNPCAKVLSIGASLVAASNATASVPGGLPLPITAQPADVRELLDKNRVRPGRVNYAPVLVASLAR